MAFDVSVDSHLAAVALIRIVATGKAPKPSRMGQATGFFFRHEGRTFLVTNRHVVVDDEQEFYPDQLIVRIHASKTSVDPTRDIALQLYDNAGNPLWFEHDNKAVDLAALELGDLLKDTDMVAYWKPERLLPPGTGLNLGTQVFVIGYPMGLYEPKDYLPIVRSATLATTYGLQFDRLPFCLIDANLHPGTSGSPVVISRSRMPSSLREETQSLPTSIVGVNSGIYSVDGVSLGLNAVWYPRLIMDILAQTANVSRPAAENSRPE